VPFNQPIKLYYKEIINDFINNISYFYPSLRELTKTNIKAYKENIYDYPLIRKKYQDLKQGFKELQSLF